VRAKIAKMAGWQEDLEDASFIALVDGKPGAYGVVVPDLPGCTSGGKTVDVRCAMPSRAVRLWAEGARAEGETCRVRAPIEVIRRDSELLQRLSRAQSSLWSRFCSMLAVPPRLISRSMAGLLEAIDEAAEAHGLTARRHCQRGTREDHAWGVVALHTSFGARVRRARCSGVAHEPRRHSGASAPVLLRGQRAEIRRNRDDVVFDRLATTGFINSGPFPRLSHAACRKAACDIQRLHSGEPAGTSPRPFCPSAVTDCTRHFFADSPPFTQRFAFGDAARRHVGDEPGMRVADFRCVGILGDFKNTAPDRLGASIGMEHTVTAGGGDERPRRAWRSRSPSPTPRLQRREIFGGWRTVLVATCLRDRPMRRRPWRVPAL